MSTLVVNYANTLGQQVNPANSSYTNITWAGTVFLLWNSQNITVSTEYYVAGKTDLNPSIANSIVQLPTVTLASSGATFTLTNQSSFAVTVLANDSTSLINISSGQTISFTSKTNVVTTTEALCWEFIVLGSSTNTNTLAQNLGNSLNFIASTNNVQVKQTVIPIQTALILTNGFYGLTSDKAIIYAATTLINPPTVTTQVNILLGNSSVLYSACGFTCTIMNEGTNPVVIQTQGDTINGVPLQTATNSASYVITPLSSIQLTSSNLGDWVVTAISTPYQRTFKTTAINLATANYVGLTAQSTPTNGSLSTIISNPLAGAAVAIDMSTNLDLIYSPLWVIEGVPPTSIQQYYQQLNQQSFWIILPNNFNSVYFVLAQSTSTQFKFGLAAKYGVSTANTVVLPPLDSSFTTYGDTTWAIQYSAAITNSPLTQFTTNLLITGGGGGGQLYPDITDDPVTGTVSITGLGGLVVPNGNVTMNSATLLGKPVAVIIPNATLGDIVTASGTGATQDSGVSISTNQQFTSPSNSTVSTTLATYAYINSLITNPYTFKGVWDPATNTPTLANGVGTLGWVYISSGTGTVNFGAGADSFVQGDLVIYNQSNEWVKIAASNYVTAVNGQVGNVMLYLQDLLGVDITSPSAGDLLVYSTAAFLTDHTVTTGTNPGYVCGGVIGSTMFFIESNYGSNNLIYYTSSGGNFTPAQTITAGNNPTGNCFFVNGSTPTLAFANNTDGTVTIQTFAGGLWGTPGGGTTQTVTVGTNPLGVAAIVNGSNIYLAVGNAGTSNVTILVSSGGAFTISQTIATTGSQPNSICGWMTGTTMYFATTNNSGNITIFSAAVSTFSVFQTLTAGNTPYGITHQLQGVVDVLAWVNENDSNVTIVSSTTNGFYGTPYNLNVGTNPRLITAITIGSVYFLVTANYGSNNLTFLISNNGENFTFLSTNTAGVGPFGLSYFQNNQINYLAVTNNTAGTMDIDTATATWINGQPEALSLSELSDVIITSPQNNQVLTYNGATTQWVNQNPATSTTADFNQVVNPGTSYTVTTTDAFKLFYNSSGTTSITLPNVSGFPIGFTVCIANAVGSATLISPGAGTSTLTFNNFTVGAPFYFKIEATSGQWLIDGQPQAQYSPVVTNALLGSNTLVANLAAGSQVNNSNILTQVNTTADNAFFRSVPLAPTGQYVILSTDNFQGLRIGMIGSGQSFLFPSCATFPVGTTVCISDQSGSVDILLTDNAANVTTINCLGIGGYYKITTLDQVNWYLSYHQQDSNFTVPVVQTSLIRSFFGSGYSVSAMQDRNGKTLTVSAIITPTNTNINIMATSVIGLFSGINNITSNMQLSTGYIHTDQGTATPPVSYSAQFILNNSAASLLNNATAGAALNVSYSWIWTYN